ncbi:TIGR00730 family Rossman fold protein [bacterium]|nr:TIGR00730 family Rossman fold protein [bacterium]
MIDQSKCKKILSKSVCVYCASSNSVSSEFFSVAEELGTTIAKDGYDLIFGGGEIGLMGAVARSVHSHGGHVVGVIPEFLRLPGICYESCDELVVTKDMRERKAAMEARADAFIALPGGFGTLEEMLEVITLKQLRILNKPAIFLNTNGFYDGLNAMFEHIFDHHFAKPHYRELYHFSPDVTDAMAHIDSYEPMALGTKW